MFQVLHGLLLVCLWLHLTQAFTPRFVRHPPIVPYSYLGISTPIFHFQVQAEAAEAEAVAGDSLPLSPEELELLEEVEKVKEKVEEKVAEVEKSLPFSYSGIKKRETYVNKYVRPCFKRHHQPKLAGTLLTCTAGCLKSSSICMVVVVVV